MHFLKPLGMAVYTCNLITQEMGGRQVVSSKPASTIQRLSHWKAKITFPLEVFQLLQILAKSDMAGLCHFSHSDRQACCYALVLICASLLIGDVYCFLRCLSVIFGASSVSIYIGDHVLFCLSWLLFFLFFSFDLRVLHANALWHMI